MARRLGAHGGRLASIRLDSGDFLELSRRCRAILDAAGLRDVTIFASGSLDEIEIARLLTQGAPIDAFGVGSRLGVSADAPYLDMAYKLVEFDGQPTLKLSTGKLTLPGRKQVWRTMEDGLLDQDVIALESEPAPKGAEPLLQPVMHGGTTILREGLRAARTRAGRERAALPPDLHRPDSLGRTAALSPGVIELRDRAIARAIALNV